MATLPGSTKPRFPQGKLALHVVDEGSPSLDYGKDARPVVLARATLLPSQRCRFEVRSNDSASNSEDTISIDRIAPAIAELGAYSLTRRSPVLG